MSWHYMYLIVGPETEAAGAEAARHAEAAVVTLDDETVAVFIPACNLTDEQAALLAEHPELIAGSLRLQWFEAWMVDDLKRTYALAEAEKTEREGKSTKTPGQKTGLRN